MRMITPFLKGVLSVQELSAHIKQLLKEAFPFVAVYGEISNLRTSKGITWFTLKDAVSQIPVVAFSAPSLSQPLANGQSVLIEGRIDVYIASGRYQLIAKNIRTLGVGELQQQFEILKEKLRQEGLFSSEKKKPLPLLPKHIGVVTSPEAAALQDFLQILQRKQWKGSILLSPALVQGYQAPPSIMKAFQALQRRPEIELIVLIRGGGSFEDLNCFNQEKLVRFLANRRKPLLTGIGHETDYTLCDFVADQRAETPTAAAEILANAYQNACKNLQIHTQHLQRTFLFHYEADKQHLHHLQKRLSAFHPEQTLLRLRQQYEQQKKQFRARYLSSLQTKQQYFSWLSSRLHAVSIQPLFERQQNHFQTQIRRLHAIFQQHYHNKTQQLSQCSQRLHALSIERHLKRGFLIPLANDQHTLQPFTPNTQWVWHQTGKWQIAVQSRDIPS